MGPGTLEITGLKSSFHDSVTEVVVLPLEKYSGMPPHIEQTHEFKKLSRLNARKSP